MAFFQQVAQVNLHHQRAARHVDQVAAKLHPLQRLAVQDAARLIRQRQQAHQHARGFEEGAEFVLARIAANTFKIAPRAAPAQHRKVKLPHRLRHARAQGAQAHDADGEIVALPRAARLPKLFFLLLRVPVELAVKTDQRMAHVLGHLHRHARVFEADNLQIGRQMERHQLVDASAQVEHRLQLRLLVKQLLRRVPDDGGVVIGRHAGLPFIDLRLGQRAAQVVQPCLRRPAVAVAQQQLHAAPMPRRSSSAPSVT